MKYNISKELFEEINGQKYSTRHFKSLLIPYDSFFFKCKEWAIVNGFSIISGTDGLGQISAYIEELGDGYRCKDFFSKSEQQAVFDGCQWILDIKESELTNNEDFVTKLSGALFQIADLRIKDKQ